MRLSQGLIPLPVVLIQGGCNQAWHGGSGGKGKTRSGRAAVNAVAPGPWAGRGPNTWISSTFLISSSENTWSLPLLSAFLWHQGRLLPTYSWSVFSAMVPRTHSVFCFFSRCLLRWKSGKIHEAPATTPWWTVLIWMFLPPSLVTFFPIPELPGQEGQLAFPGEVLWGCVWRPVLGSSKEAVGTRKSQTMVPVRWSLQEWTSALAFHSTESSLTACASNCFGKSGTLKDHENSVLLYNDKAVHDTAWARACENMQIQGHDTCWNNIGLMAWTRQMGENSSTEFVNRGPWGSPLPDLTWNLPHIRLV